jgi:hypothetical protein
MAVSVGAWVAVPVGGTGVGVVLDVGVDGTEVAACGLRQPANSTDIIHIATHARRRDLNMNGLIHAKVIVLRVTIYRETMH